MNVQKVVDMGTYNYFVMRSDEGNWDDMYRCIGDWSTAAYQVGSPVDPRGLAFPDVSSYAAFVGRWKALEVTNVEFRFSVSDPMDLAVTATLGRTCNSVNHLILDLPNKVYGLNVDGTPNTRFLDNGTTLTTLAPASPQGAPAMRTAGMTAQISKGPQSANVTQGGACQQLSDAQKNVAAALDRLKTVGAEAAQGQPGGASSSGGWQPLTQLRAI